MTGYCQHDPHPTIFHGDKLIIVFYVTNLKDRSWLKFEIDTDDELYGARPVNLNLKYDPSKGIKTLY